MVNSISKGWFYTVSGISHLRAPADSCVRFFVTILALVAINVSAQERQFVPGRILIKPRAHLSEAEFSRRTQASGARHHKMIHGTNVRVLAVPAEQTEPLLRALQADPDIEFAE